MATASNASRCVNTRAAVEFWENLTTSSDSSPNRTLTRFNDSASAAESWTPSDRKLKAVRNPWNAARVVTRCGHQQRTRPNRCSPGCSFRFDPPCLVGYPVRLPPGVRELVGEDPRLPAGPSHLRQPVHIQINGGVHLGQVTADFCDGSTGVDINGDGHRLQDCRSRSPNPGSVVAPG